MRTLLLLIVIAGCGQSLPPVPDATSAVDAVIDASPDAAIDAAPDAALASCIENGPAPCLCGGGTCPNASTAEACLQGGINCGG